MNIFEILKENITDDIVKKTAVALDETPDNTRLALESMMHTLVGGLMKRTTSTMGLNQLYSQIQKSGFDITWLGNLAETIAKPDKLSELIVKGGSLTSQLFPAMKSQISGMVLGFSGIRSSSASSLISIATPMVVALLGKVVREKQMTADNLAEFLGEQRDNLVKETSPELMDKMVNVLALQDIVSGKIAPVKISTTPVVDTRPSVSSKQALKPPVFEQKQVTNYASDETEKSEGGSPVNLKWFLIALAAVGLIVAGVFGFRYFNNQPEVEVADEVIERTPIPTDSTKIDSTKRDSILVKIDTTKVVASKPIIDSSKIVVAAPVPVKLPAGVKSAFAAKLMGGKVGEAILATGLDYEVNSINQAPVSAQVVSDLVKILNANPTMQIKIINLSNDALAPQDNKALSVARAYDLKKKLLVAGIDVNRVNAAGIGSGVNNANLKQTLIKLISK